MKSINCVIVKTVSLYDNVRDGLIINDSIESVSNINRVGVVISTPDSTILNVGDEVIIHHNIFRKKYNVNGKQVNSDFWLEDDIYFVPFSEIFMFKRGSDSWKAISPFCFIKPIKDETINPIGFSISDETHKGRINHVGIVSFTNDDLCDHGVTEGMEVIFAKNSEYEFIIDNEVHYKMKTNDIFGRIDERT